MSLKAFSRNPQQIFKPYTFIIEDSYGESLILSKDKEAGDVLSLATNGRDQHGNITSISVNGNYHNDRKQNAIDKLGRLVGMVNISEQENQSLLAILGHPQIELRGRVTNLNGPNWTSAPQPIFYTWSFDFVRDTIPFQPKDFRILSEVKTAEGKDHTLFTIPNAALTDLTELAYAYYGKNYSDGRKIKDIIRLNQFTIPQIRALVPGSIIRMPLN